MAKDLFHLGFYAFDLKLPLWCLCCLEELGEIRQQIIPSTCWSNDFRHQDSVFSTRTTRRTLTNKFHISFLNHHITSKFSRRLLRKYRFKNKGLGNPIRNLFPDPCSYHLLISGYHKIRNQRMRAVNGNTVTLNLERLLWPTYTYSRADMLAVRQTNPPTSNLSFTTQPRPSPRTGQRRVKWSTTGRKIFYHPRKNSDPSKTILLHDFLNSSEFIPVQPPPPPPKGAPGTPTGSDEECKQERGRPNLSKAHSRAYRRQQYRLWKRHAGNQAGARVGNWRLVRPQPLKAAHRNTDSCKRSHWFKAHILSTLHAPGGRGPHAPHTLPPEKLPYASSLKVGTLNVQGSASILKQQISINYMKERSIDLLFLTETRTHAFHAYTSETYKFVCNGSTTDPHAGVTAVLSPLIIPYIKDVVQVNERIIHISLYAQSGTIHFIGVYAPHNGLDYESKRLPFWDFLEDYLGKLPQPEPWYVIGDLNVRLQGRFSHETSELGPHIFGKGRLHANTSPQSNRTLFLRMLKALRSVDVMSHKTSRLLRQITYKEKTAPAKTWGQLHSDLALPPGILNNLFSTWDIGLEIATTVRSFLLATPLPKLSQTPELDPVRFQSLDRAIVNSKWLPSILSLQAYHSAGFPSDHYPLELVLRVKLAQRKARPPKQFALDYPTFPDDPRIPHFNSLLRAELDPLTPAFSNEPPRTEPEVTVYTDGSGTHGKCSARTPAGWGWTLTADHHHFTDSAGPVITDPANPGYLGAQVGSNNTGELSAWIESALSLLSSDAPLPSSITFVYDSQWAQKVITGQWRAKRHKNMVQTARSLYQQLTAQARINWKWVKGHTGNKGNERADRLADTGKQLQTAFGGRYNKSNLPPIPAQPAAAQQPQTNSNIDDAAAQLTKAIVRSATIAFGQPRRKPKQPWISANTLQLLTSARTLLAVDDPAANDKLKEAKKAARQDKIKWIHQQLEGDGTHNNRNMWQLARRQRKGFTARRTRLQHNGRAVPWSQTHEAFRDHYENVQWAPKNITPEHLSSIQQRPAMRMGPAHPLNPITPEEITSAIQKLKKGKAPGHDALTPDMLIALDIFGETKLLQLLNQCMDTRSIPNTWKIALVVSIYKGKGPDHDPASYRPISLLPVLYKVYASILQQRIADELDTSIRSTQYGFRASRSTTQPLFLVRRLQDWSRALDKPVHLLFLDWKQAFDTIDHSALIAALKRWNLHEGYIEIIQDFYTNPQFSTVGMNGAQAHGQASSGIRQGCPLSPYLFILLLTVLMHDTENRLLRMGTPTNTWSVGKPIFDIEYADDTLLFGITTPQLESMLHALEHEAMVYGLTLNISKSEHLIQPGQEGNNMTFSSGDPVPTTTCSKYLGSQITWQKPTDTALTARFGLASAAYKSLRTIWNSRLTIRVKLRIFQSVIVSTLIYSLDSLTMLPKHFRRLNSFFFRLLRRVVGVKAAYISRVSNITVWELAGHPTTPAQIILQQQTKLLLKCLATPPNDPFHHVVFCSALRDRIECNKKSSRGRPPPHWLSLMLGYLQLPINHFFPHHPQITNPMTLRQLIHKTPQLSEFLVTAPTRAFLFPFLQLQRQQQQRAGQD